MNLLRGFERMGANEYGASHESAGPLFFQDSPLWPIAQAPGKTAGQ
jgi:hypothetical protein